MFGRCTKPPIGDVGSLLLRCDVGSERVKELLLPVVWVHSARSKFGVLTTISDHYIAEILLHMMLKPDKVTVT